jgi:hypothetical protein
MCYGQRDTAVQRMGGIFESFVLLQYFFILLPELTKRATATARRRGAAKSANAKPKVHRTQEDVMN